MELIVTILICLAIYLAFSYLITERKNMNEQIEVLKTNESRLKEEVMKEQVKLKFEQLQGHIDQKLNAMQNRLESARINMHADFEKDIKDLRKENLALNFKIKENVPQIKQKESGCLIM